MRHKAWSSGGPIINSDNLKVIAIHKGSNKEKTMNIGKLINEPIKKFYELNKKSNSNYNNSIPNGMEYRDEEDDDLKDTKYEKNNEVQNSNEDKEYNKQFSFQNNNYILNKDNLENKEYDKNESNHEHSFSYYNYANKKCNVCLKEILIVHAMNANVKLFSVWIVEIKYYIVTITLFFIFIL
jgi:hypothetical protein